MKYEITYVGKSNGEHHYEVIDTSDDNRLIGPYLSTNKAIAKSEAHECARGLARFDLYENHKNFVTTDPKQK